MNVRIVYQISDMVKQLNGVWLTATITVKQLLHIKHINSIPGSVILSIMSVDEVYCDIITRRRLSTL